MGRQVRLFAAPDDFLELEQALRMKTDFLALADRSQTSAPERADFVLPAAQMGEKSVHICLARQEDLSNIVVRHVPAQSYWSVDILRSPVIEVRRCFLKDEILRQGRLFMDAGFYREDKWCDKPDAFLKWAKLVFGVTKKVFKRDSIMDAYVGRYAEAWRVQGNGNFVDDSGAIPSANVKAHGSR
jgi:hypothetical protein